MDKWINMNGSYRNEKDIDEWGCACVSLNDEDGAEYNYCMENGESYCAIYGYTLVGDPDNYHYYATDFDCYRHYDIEWDKPNWKELLIKEMEDFAKEWQKKYKEGFLKESLKWY